MTSCVFQDEISVRGDEVDMNDPTWADKLGCPSEEEKMSPQNVPGPGEDGELAAGLGGEGLRCGMCGRKGSWVQRGVLHPYCGS